MRQKLVDSIAHRLKHEVSSRNPVKFLQQIDAEDVVDVATSTLYLYTRTSRSFRRKDTGRLANMAEVASAVGHAVRNHMKERRDSALAVKSGAFILYSFELAGIIQLEMTIGDSGHGTYFLKVTDDDALSALWDNLKLEKTEKLPALEPYADWTSTKHDTGAILVKTENREVLQMLSPETHPMVFGCVNKAQKIGWTINKDVYSVFVWALRNKTEAFSDIWELQNQEARASKVREAKTVGSIAKRFLDKTFYH
jgi:hypothetical protein